MTRVGVVMPVLNERHRVADSIARLRAHPFAEIVVVDGGSTDGTRALLDALPVTVIDSRPGRGHQLNVGASQLTSDVYLFVHCDVILPESAVEDIRGALCQGVWGAFTIRTVMGDPAPRWSGLLRIADIRSRMTRYPYGDQALFVRAETFHEVGGYRTLPLFEDLDLSQRLHEIGACRRIWKDVIVSGRRWRDRPVRTTALMNFLPLLYRVGVSPGFLARLYGHARG